MKFRFPRTRLALILIASTLITTGLSTPSSATDYPEYTVGKNGFVFEKLHTIQAWGSSKTEIAARLDQQINLIHAIQTSLKARGTKLVIALVPMVHRIYQAQLPETFKLPSIVPSLYSITAERLNHLGVLTPDIETPFREYAHRDQLQTPLFMRADHHWSPTGALEAARIVANAIQKQYGPELSTMPEVRYSMVLRAAKTYPDYGSFYRSLPAAQRAGIKLDSIRVPEFSVQTTPEASNPQANPDPSGLGLLTETSPRIAVVGTSFSAIQAFGFANSIAQRLSRDVLNTAQAGKEAWRPLGEYIASDAYQNSPPSILIWEIPQAFLIVGMKPVHNSDDWSARQYLLELGANLHGDCGQGSQPIATNANDFTVQTTKEGTKASITSTRITSFVKYQFATAIKANQYLSLNAASSTSDSLIVEGEGSKPQRYYVKLPSYGGTHRINVPLATLANGKTHSLKIRTAIHSDLSLENPKLCALPAELAALAGAGY
jgi:alginate O-acetyltransferase complex protein AlgJ